MREFFYGNPHLQNNGMTLRKSRPCNGEIEQLIKLHKKQGDLAKFITANSELECTQQNISSWLYSSKGVPKNAARHLIVLFPTLNLERLLFPPEFESDRNSSSSEDKSIAVVL